LKKVTFGGLLKNKDMSLKTDITNWIKDYASDKFKLVVGISGGIDSAVVSTLCAETGIETYAVTIPISQNKQQLENARNHINWLKTKYKNVKNFEYDMTKTFDLFSKNFEIEQSDLSLANSKSRLRMMTLYHVSNNVNGIVVGTGNKVEDFGVGFFTKYGDGGVDISPIADLYKSEVFKLGKELDIIPEIQNAKPSDGLWDDDRDDETQIGATYDELEWVMENYNETQQNLSKREIEVLEIYNKFNNNNKHKMVNIPIFKKTK
jgi:NAD+ synthase